MTPVQKAIVHNKCIDTTFYLHLVCWFRAHNPGFKDLNLDCPQIHLVEDTESPHNTDKERDPTTETQCEEGLFTLQADKNHLDHLRGNIYQSQQAPYS